MKVEKASFFYELYVVIYRNDKGEEQRTKWTFILYENKHLSRVESKPASMNFSAYYTIFGEIHTTNGGILKKEMGRTNWHFTKTHVCPLC